MQEQKTIFRLMWIPAIFMVIGLVLASWLLPDLLEWYASPFLPEAVSCAPTLRWTIRKMLWLQITCSMLGLLLGLWVLYRIYLIKQRSIKKV